MRGPVLAELNLLPLYRRRAASLAPAEVPDQPALEGQPDAGRMAAPDAPALAHLDWPQLIAAMQACPICARSAPDAPAVAGVGAQPALNQSDGIHPTADGYRVIVERLWPLVEAVLAREGIVKHENRPPGGDPPGGRGIKTF